MSTPSATVSGSAHNSTTIPDPGDTDAWKTTTSPRITFLSFFLLFGMVGNTCLILTICHSRRFRTTAFYIFIINLTVVNLCECLLNMTILMSTSVANTWSHGDIPCRLNAFFIHLVCIETLLSLTILTTDRMVAVKYREKYDHVVSLARFTLLISFSWIQSFAFSLPIAVDAVPVNVEENIHYCTLAKGASVAYCAFLTILCYIGPLIICVCFFIFIVRTWYKDRFAVRALLAQNNYDENAKEEPRIRREILYSNLSATVCVSWIILEGPYIATFIFKLFQTSVELNNISDENSIYAWHVDLVLLFLKFSYVLVLPAAAFVWLKELRKELRDIVLCRKNNAVIDESMKRSEVEVQRLKSSQEEDTGKEMLSKHKENRVFQVPVLFATSHGVHIKKPTERETDELEKTTINGEILGMKCDVLGSKDNLNALEDDTSDYDSGNEMDPFSVSHPVSVKHLTKNNSLTEQHRSNSQPEVSGRSGKVKVCNNTVGSTSAGDSGLDLRSEYNSMSRPSLESTKEHSTSLINAVEIKARTNESLTHELNLPQEKRNDIMNTDSKQKAGLAVPEAIKSPSEKTILSNNGDAVDTAIIYENISKIDPSLNFTEIEYVNKSPVVDKRYKRQQESSDAVFQKRKKKKRREKIDDVPSISSNDCASSPQLPLRPPPRLAPIGATSLNRSSLTRPGSSCSNNSSLLGGNYNDCVRSQYSIGLIGDSEYGSHSSLTQNLCKSQSDNQINVEEESSKVCENLHEVHNTADIQKPAFAGSVCDRSNLMSLNCSIPTSSPVEVLTPSDCHMSEGLPIVDEPVDHIVDGIENPSFVADHNKNHRNHVRSGVLGSDCQSDNDMALSRQSDKHL